MQNWSSQSYLQEEGSSCRIWARLIWYLCSGLWWGASDLEKLKPWRSHSGCGQGDSSSNIVLSGGAMLWQQPALMLEGSVEQASMSSLYATVDHSSIVYHDFGCGFSLWKRLYNFPPIFPYFPLFLGTQLDYIFHVYIVSLLNQVWP